MKLPIFFQEGVVVLTIWIRFGCFWLGLRSLVRVWVRARVRFGVRKDLI
jgi:hypothetical protein